MQLITVKELSKFIRVKESTLYAWASSGSIPSHKLNGLLRFDIDEIKEWVKESGYMAEPIPALPVQQPKPLDIDTVVKKAVDEVKRKRYNKANGKPDRNQGLRKEA